MSNNVEEMENIVDDAEQYYETVEHKALKISNEGYITVDKTMVSDAVDVKVDTKVTFDGIDEKLELGEVVAVKILAEEEIEDLKKILLLDDDESINSVIVLR